MENSSKITPFRVIQIIVCTAAIGAYFYMVSLFLANIFVNHDFKFVNFAVHSLRIVFLSK